MFIDKVDIFVKAGKGGNGCVSFRREKYVAKGGPDGGDGGNGGSVIFEIDEGENTLLPFKYRRKFVAANGGDGMPQKFHGKTAPDLIIKVPQGTLIKDKESGKIVFDMGTDGRFVAAKGGIGGWGNVHFATPTRQVPRFAKSGTEGQERELTLELKMLADVGLVGLPNVGKSTLLSMVSAARPKIADYHFTTLSPMLGVVSVGEGASFVMADIPGLIEGASDGLGLGHDFLRHVDRCRLLVHVVDASASEGRDPVDDIETVNLELIKYSEELSRRPQIIVANKCDIGVTEENKEALEHYAEVNGVDLFFISAAARENVDELMKAIYKKVSALPPIKSYEADFVPEEPAAADFSFEVTVEDGVYYLSGAWLEKLISNVNFSDYESVSFFQKVLRDKGVIKALEDAGIEEDDTVDISGVQFDFVF
ncbi:MAG: GTPase ObgE [Clostridia bacterium]|nr:GTPase ObgE [Clostridia bacterium]